MTSKLFFFIVLVSIGLCSCKKGVTEPTPFGAIPTEHQLKWQEQEYYMFIHFGPNTFTNVEWGDGKENPQVFNPTDLNTNQWASIAKDAGMKGIIITAKHHDGFCLWPSQYSTHTVRESLWKEGKGDLLKDLSASCAKYDLLFGVYLSPWDQNHPAYNSPEYNEIFAKTLDEVLTGYGHVFEQWFDGATGKGSTQVYDWSLFNSTVYKNQPHAIIFSDVGPGCRWIGNERGYAGETNWATINAEGYTPGKGSPDRKFLNEGEENGSHWLPGEVDVSIRPGWFYSSSTDDKVKSVEHLMDIYYSSVGRNANLLLNVPPDRRGLIHPIDSARLIDFKKARDNAFADNLAKNVRATVNNIRGNSKTYSIDNLFDGDKDTYWTTDDGIYTANIEIELPKETIFNNILLQEYIALGQRIAEFKIQYWNIVNQQWEDLTQATTVGYKRILRTPTVSTNKIKIEILRSLAEPILSNLEIFHAPDIPSFELTKFDKKTANKTESVTKKLGTKRTLKGFRFTPYPSEKEVTIMEYNLYTSVDGIQWEKVISNGVFNNIKNNPIPQEVLFGHPIEASTLKIEPVKTTDDKFQTYTWSNFEALNK